MIHDRYITPNLFSILYILSIRAPSFFACDSPTYFFFFSFHLLPLCNLTYRIFDIDNYVFYSKFIHAHVHIHKHRRTYTDTYIYYYYYYYYIYITHSAIFLIYRYDLHVFSSKYIERIYIFFFLIRVRVCLYACVNACVRACVRLRVYARAFNVFA